MLRNILFLMNSTNASETSGSRFDPLPGGFWEKGAAAADPTVLAASPGFLGQLITMQFAVYSLVSVSPRGGYCMRTGSFSILFTFIYFGLAHGLPSRFFLAQINELEDGIKELYSSVR